MRRITIPLLLTVLLTTTACARPAPALHWDLVNPLPTNADLHGIAAHGDVKVAVGQKGTIETATAGSDFTLRDSGVTADLRAVAAGPGGFVAVGDGVILGSADGRSWAPRRGAEGEHLRAVACSPSLCVAAGDRGAMLTGTPAGNWSAVAADTGGGANMLAVAYGGGLFVAAGEKGVALSSPDGKTWTRLMLPAPRDPSVAGFNLTGVAAADGFYAISGFELGSFVLVSHDGRMWERQESPPGVRAITFGGGRAVALSWALELGAYAYFTDDKGATWQKQPNGYRYPQGNALTWDGQQFLAAGDAGYIKSSADGVTWTTLAPGGGVAGWPTAGWADVAYGAGRFVTVANGDTAVSTDGVNWEFPPRPPEPLSLWSIVRGPDQFMTVGYGIFTSPDGLTWTRQPFGEGKSLHQVAYGSGRYVTISGQESYASADGVTWVAGNLRGQPDMVPEEGRYFSAIAAGDAGFVAFSSAIRGRTVEVYTSADGLTWQAQGEQPLMMQLAYGKGLYAAVANDASIRTSPDGRQWTVAKKGMPFPGAILFAGDRFLTVGEEHPLTSLDGRTWTPAGPLPAPHGVLALAFGAGRFVAVGADGTILTASAQ